MARKTDNIGAASKNGSTGVKYPKGDGKKDVHFGAQKSFAKGSAKSLKAAERKNAREMRG
jgi:hypothetical protein